ncbi:synaptotagmin-8 isoform X1 [Saccopteryx bilineata]|uniref:synaptotagmin-8 isoform X1 n=1 Tax=Saccopteryx bilineata TaxID=59482 RepID=UPI00338D8846
MPAFPGDPPARFPQAPGPEAGPQLPAGSRGVDGATWWPRACLNLHHRADPGGLRDHVPSQGLWGPLCAHGQYPEGPVILSSQRPASLMVLGGQPSPGWLRNPAGPAARIPVTHCPPHPCPKPASRVERWDSPQTPAAPQPLWVPQQNPGSFRTSLPGSPVQPDVDDVEPSPGGGQQWGRLQLSLEYDFGSQEIRVGLKQAVDLKAGGPGGTADPYAYVSLSTQAGHGHETKVHHGTLCPVFDETCSFRVPPAELSQTALRVRVLDFRRFPEPEPLGELSLPLGAMDLRHVLEGWHRLGPPGTAEAEQASELCFSLRYVPSSGRLTVAVLEARGLRPGPAESYVKVQLMLNQRKWKRRKTSARRSTAAPYFNEAFAFLVPFSQIQNLDLVLAVWARSPRFRAEPVGKVMLGSRASGQPLQHWADMLAHARRPIARWHRLQPAREVDQALALQSRRRPPLPLPGS